MVNYEHQLALTYIQRLLFNGTLTSTIFVRFANGLKNNAIDLCDNNNSNALTKRIPCIVVMSFGSLVTLTSDLPFFIKENAVNRSSEKDFALRIDLFLIIVQWHLRGLSINSSMAVEIRVINTIAPKKYLQIIYKQSQLGDITFWYK